MISKFDVLKELSIMQSSAEISLKCKNPSGRLMSLDALRGLDMFLLVGIGGIFRALPELSDNHVFVFLAEQCHHPEWQGFALWDLIFPLFIFIVGVSIPLSLTKRAERDGKRSVYRHVFFRAVILSLLGLVYWRTPGGVHPSWGYYSVLYRIGVCYFFAAVVFLNFNPKGQLRWAFGIIAGYYLVMRFVPTLCFGAGDFSQEGAVCMVVKQWVADTLSPNWQHVFSINLFPSVANAILGGLAGQWLLSSKSPQSKTLGLLLAGAAFVAFSFIADLSFPFNKKLVSTSFTFLVCGVSALLLGVFYWVIDVRGYRKWAFVFVVVGMNPIVIYLGSRYIEFGRLSDVFLGGFTDLLGSAYPLCRSLVSAALMWYLLYYLYRNKIFLKV